LETVFELRAVLLEEDLFLRMRQAFQQMVESRHRKDVFLTLREL